MAVTGKTALADSQVEVYDAAVHVFGQNLNSLDNDGSVTLGGSINGADNVFHIYTKLTPVTTPLTDGTEATPITMADSKVTITPAEYGAVVTPTSLADASTAGKASMAAAKMVGINIVESPNAKGCAVLEAGTNSTAAATLNTLAKGDLRIAYTKLENAGVLKIDGYYRCRANPDQIADIKDDYQGYAQYTTLDGVTSGQVPHLEGFMIIPDRAVTAGTVVCYGDNALGKSESVATSATIVDGTDNLNRLRNYGWYGIYEYGIVDQNALQVITGA